MMLWKIFTILIIFVLLSKCHPILAIVIKKSLGFSKNYKNSVCFSIYSMNMSVLYGTYAP